MQCRPWCTWQCCCRSHSLWAPGRQGTRRRPRCRWGLGFRSSPWQSLGAADDAWGVQVCEYIYEAWASKPQWPITQHADGHKHPPNSESSLTTCPGHCGPQALCLGDGTLPYFFFFGMLTFVWHGPCWVWEAAGSRQAERRPHAVTCCRVHGSVPAGPTC